MTEQDLKYIIRKIRNVNPNAELIKAAKQIKPLCLINQYGNPIHNRLSENYSELRYVKPADIYKETFYFKEPVCKTPKLVKLAEIKTLHLSDEWVFYPKFKEIYAQIPRYLKDKVVAFETYLPKEKSLKENRIFGCYQATTCFYGLAPHATVPQEIKNQKVICEGMVYPAKDIDQLEK